MAHSRRARLHEFENSKELSYLEKQILKYLHDHYQSPTTTIETLKICHGIGKKTKKEINPGLYSLQKKGYIKKVQDSPPLWCLNKYEDMPSSSHLSDLNPSIPNPAYMDGGVSATEFTTDDFSPRQAYAGAATLPIPGGQQSYDTTVQGRLFVPEKKDEFVIPPSPAELLRNTMSVFGCMNLQESKNDADKHGLQAQLLRVLNNYDKLSTFQICQKISGHEINAINQALFELLKSDKVEKFGEYYSLPTFHGSVNETIPKSHYMSADVHGPITGKAFNSYNFTSDEVAMPAFSTAPVNDAATAARPPLVLPEGRNAISVLNEYAQSRRLRLDYKESISGPDHMRRFQMTVWVGGQRFTGVLASTKKDAKLRAAEIALAKLFQAGEVLSAGGVTAPTYLTPSQEATIHQRVASLVLNKYNELMQQLPDTITGRKIIAGIVMSRKIKSGETLYEVVSIGSGNRCVCGDKLSLRGETVNDCHAEVIARRGLVRYLYRELLKYREENVHSEDSKFKVSEDRFAITSDVEFHLYISTAPCGDSAIFAPSDAATDDPSGDIHDGAHHPLFENKKQGLLRTKVENGEGCIPIDEDTAAPTWDGILRGERLRTMSCSDKIAKWNFLGLQGSLLSHFMDPIYLSTLTLGMLYNHGHLTRAVCCRVEKFMGTLDKDLLPPTPYKVHHPVVALSSHGQSRETGKIKTREFSVNWSLGDVKPEVLDGTEGKCEQRFGSTNPPQICKAELFKHFRYVCAKMSFMSSLQQEGYYDCKQAATAYQTAKNLFRYAFEKNGFGKWMPKPKEEKDF